MGLPTSFGLWLKERRKLLDLTQADLANCVGCSTMTIRKIEADERRPSRQIAELLANCLEIALEDQPTFLKVARAELRVDRLPMASPLQLPGEPELPKSLEGRPGALSTQESLEALLAARAARPSDHGQREAQQGEASSAQAENETLSILPLRLPISPPPRVSSLLPTPLSPLLGREHELANLARLLENPQCRLLTLIGPGGIGKTRLAIEAATHQYEAFADGVYFISLAPVTSTELMIPAIANALGFIFYNPADLQAQLLNYLREKSMLLVLDNFEQLLPSAQADIQAGLDLLVAILQSAPAVKLLVTSRERMHLQWEWVFDVQGLPVPSTAHPDGLETNSAVALFLQGARRAQADFKLTAEEQSAVVRICQLLGGMPLGIELAAAWVRVLSCREIAQEIERGLDFLAASARDLPERHRSLRLTFDHSWKLLSAEEQGVMRRLSVFRGGFRRKAAERVAGASLPVLMALVDKSLLRRTETGRYDLHELVRQYAAGHLQQMPDEEQNTRERHCDYFSTLLQQAEPQLKGVDQKAILAELDVEIDNLRLAWDWAVAQRDVARFHQSAFALFLFYLSRNWVQEGAELLQRAGELLQATVDNLLKPPPDLVAILGRVLAFQGWFRMWGGQLPLARELVMRNLALLRSLNLPVALSDALRVQGVFLQMTGDVVAARACLEESLAIKRTLGDEWEVGIGLAYLGRFAQMQGAHEDAYGLISEAVAISRRYSDRLSTARALGFLSASALALSRHEEARHLAQESLTISQEVGDYWSIANVLNVLGVIALAQGDTGEARYFFRESVALYRQIGDRWSMARVLINLGEALNALGQPAEAWRFLLDALQTANEVQVTPVALDALMGLAKLHAQEQAIETALELLMHLLHHPATSQETKDQAEKLRADLEAQLTPFELAAIQAKAQTKSFETVVKERLG